METLFFALLSTLIISLLAVVGLIIFIIKKDHLNQLLIYLISFSAGALFGNVFFHLIPEISEETGFNLNLGFFLIGGIIFTLILEKIIRWRHIHLLPEEKKISARPVALMNLWSDFFHNLLDGMAIISAYSLNFATGLATTLAVVFHEIPQEIGDFAVLVYGGLKAKKATILNFLTALSAILGVFLAYFFGQRADHFFFYLAAFVAGNFVYIAGSDLIPELHRETKISKGLIQVGAFGLGVVVMFLLTFLE